MGQPSPSNVTGCVGSKGWSEMLHPSLIWISLGSCVGRKASAVGGRAATMPAMVSRRRSLVRITGYPWALQYPKESGFSPEFTILLQFFAENFRHGATHKAKNPSRFSPLR